MIAQLVPTPHVADCARSGRPNPLNEPFYAQLVVHDLHPPVDG